MKSKFIALFLGLCLLFSGLAACGGTLIEGEDKNKTQIYVSIFNGGYGTAWLSEIKKQFEADYPDYQVMIKGTSDDDLFSGATSLNYNVYFTTTSATFKSLCAKDLFADLSDVYISVPCIRTEEISKFQVFYNR